MATPLRLWSYGRHRGSVQVGGWVLAWPNAPGGSNNVVMKGTLFLFSVCFYIVALYKRRGGKGGCAKGRGDGLPRARVRPAATFIERRVRGGGERQAWRRPSSYQRVWSVACRGFLRRPRDGSPLRGSVDWLGTEAFRVGGEISNDRVAGRPSTMAMRWASSHDHRWADGSSRSRGGSDKRAGEVAFLTGRVDLGVGRVRPGGSSTVWGGAWPLI